MVGWAIRNGCRRQANWPDWITRACSSTRSAPPAGGKDSGLNGRRKGMSSPVASTVSLASSRCGRSRSSITSSAICTSLPRGRLPWMLLSVPLSSRRWAGSTGSTMVTLREACGVGAGFGLSLEQAARRRTASRAIGRRVMGCSIAVESGRRLYSAKCDSCRASRSPQRPIPLAFPSVPAPVDSAGARSGADALPCGFLQLRLYQHHALSLLRCP